MSETGWLINKWADKEIIIQCVVCSDVNYCRAARMTYSNLPTSEQLIYAVGENDIEAIQNVIERGALINLQTIGRGLAAIHFAHTSAVIDLLVFHGADLMCRLFEGGDNLLEIMIRASQNGIFAARSRENAKRLVSYGAWLPVGGIPNWLEKHIVKQRSCFECAAAVLQLKKRSSQTLFGNNRDVLRLIATLVWRHRWPKRKTQTICQREVCVHHVSLKEECDKCKSL